MRLFAPISHLTDAVVMPFKALFVVGLCAAINAMTFNGNWWFRWVALGMGIATVVALARGLKALLLLLLLLLLLAWAGHRHRVCKRYGRQAHEHFDAWAQHAEPQLRQVVDIVRQGAAPSRGLH